jgi:DNA-binding XRE family transcriptional regulator
MKGCEFRVLRKQIGLRQVEVAGALKVTRETIVHWETKDKGEWEIPFGWSEAMKLLSKDIGMIKNIKKARVPRRTLPYTERIARRVRKIEEAISKE